MQRSPARFPHARQHIDTGVAISARRLFPRPTKDRKTPRDRVLVMVMMFMVLGLMMLVLMMLVLVMLVLVMLVLVMSVLMMFMMLCAHDVHDARARPGFESDDGDRARPFSTRAAQSRRRYRRNGERPSARERRRRLRRAASRHRPSHVNTNGKRPKVSREVSRIGESGLEHIIEHQLRRAQRGDAGRLCTANRAPTTQHRAASVTASKPGGKRAIQRDANKRQRQHVNIGYAGQVVGSQAEERLIVAQFDPIALGQHDRCVWEIPNRYHRCAHIDLRYAIGVRSIVA